MVVILLAFAFLQGAPELHVSVDQDRVSIGEELLYTVQRELVPYFTRHYIPVWRELWMPAMNARAVAERP